MNQIDTRAYLLWLLCALTVLFLLDSAVVDLIAILAAAAVAASRTGPTPFRSFLVLGLVFLVLRTILFALTGHAGQTILVELPVIGLPAALGGTTLGGPVTAEVVITTALESLRMVAVIACFGAFISVTETIEVMRLVPRFLFEAALVVNIGMAFAPQLARSARDLRDAQIMRGARRRGWSSVAPTVVPLLASALERSITLAESMDSRGFGRARGPARSEATWQAVAGVSGLLAAGSAAFWALRRPASLAAASLVLASLVLTYALSRLSRLVSRTRYRRRRWTQRDRAVAALSLLAAAGALFIARTGTPGSFDPYQNLSPPRPNLAAVTVATALVVPALAARRETES